MRVRACARGRASERMNARTEIESVDFDFLQIELIVGEDAFGVDFFRVGRRGV